MIFFQGLQHFLCQNFESKNAVAVETLANSTNVTNASQIVIHEFRQNKDKTKKADYKTLLK